MALQPYNLLIHLLIRPVSFSDLFVQLDQNNFLYYVKKRCSTPISMICKIHTWIQLLCIQNKLDNDKWLLSGYRHYLN